jgi:diphthine-ammonia ligase
MKFVALLSGGKDSCFNIIKCQQYGHELVCLANLHTDSCEEVDSFMYQTAGSSVIPAYAELFGVPLYRGRTDGKATVLSLSYRADEKDEVEDLYNLLLTILRNHPDLEAVSCGSELLVDVISYNFIRGNSI